jgi:hypothetical protein
MSRGVLIDLFNTGEFHEIMQMFHHSFLHDNPILANSVAQFIFMWTDDTSLDECDVGLEERRIIQHLTEQLIKADEVRFQKKKCPLAQEYQYLESKEIH